jgi:chaperone required for assembly of F1-ATPase
MTSSVSSSPSWELAQHQAAAASQPVLPKKFYRSVAVEKAGEGAWRILLETAKGKASALKTREGQEMRVATRPLADAIAHEWDAQNEVIDVQSMIYYRLASMAQDMSPALEEGLRQELARYAETELLCYRADEPEALIKEQYSCWQPWLEWAQRHYGITLEITAGIMPVNQSATALEALSTAVGAIPQNMLPAFAVWVKNSGSLLLALAAWEKRINAEELYRFSHLEEHHQQREWGVEPLAQARLEQKKKEIFEAYQYINFLDAAMPSR